jgi:DNA-binding transcriptional MerR regulator
MVEIGSVRLRKPFYKNLEDTLADAGIKKRQLSYWRKHGLFVPELGQGSRYYTLRDIEFLVFLRRLIDELGLPVATVRHLIDAVGGQRLQPSERMLLDIRDRRLLSPRDAIRHLMIHALASSDMDEIKNWFRMLAMELLRQSAEAAPTAGVYAATKQDLNDQLEQVDLLVRVSQMEDGRPTFEPALPGDPELDAVSLEKAQEWIDEREKLSIPLIRARSRTEHERSGSAWIETPESHIFEPQPSRRRSKPEEASMPHGP